MSASKMQAGPLDRAEPGLRPLGGYVLVEPLPETDWSVLIADPQRSTSPVPPLTRGRVRAIGPGKYNRAGARSGQTQFTVSQVVRFERYHALEVTGSDGQTYYLIDEYHILAAESGPDEAKVQTAGGGSLPDVLSGRASGSVLPDGDGPGL